MRQAARSRPPPSCARRPVSLVRRARARQPPPATVGGARSRAREFCSISSCKGNDHASFSCSPHSVPCGECGERIGSHNSCALRRSCCKSFEAFDAPCPTTENRLAPVVPHDGDGVDRPYPACGRVVWVPSWRGDTFWACTRVLPQLKVVLFFVSCPDLKWKPPTKIILL